MSYRKAAHTNYSLHYHFVFITKYRKPVLRGDVARRLRDLVREICRTNDIEILKGHVRPEHVHLLLSVPPHLAPARPLADFSRHTTHRLQAMVVEFFSMLWVMLSSSNFYRTVVSHLFNATQH